MLPEIDDRKCENCKWWQSTIGAFGCCENINVASSILAEPIPQISFDFCCRYHEPKETKED